MARICFYCDKAPMSGNIISHSNIKTKVRRLPNLQKVRTQIAGTVRRVYACTRCIRSGWVQKPLVRSRPVPAQEAQA